MDHYESSSREIFDDVDIARQSNQSLNNDNLYDAVDTNRETEVSSGHTQEDSLQFSADNVLPNPGVSRDDEEYFMGNRDRGVALIFSHEKFDFRDCYDGNGQPEERTGTDIDREALRKAFRSLGFKVHCFNDLRHHQIINELRSVAEQNHRNRDCVAVVVLSHGGRQGKLMAEDRRYDINELWEPFTARHCPSLTGKPKLFFIQACKGNDTDPGVTVSGVTTDAPDRDHAEELTYPVPSYADILVSYSTFEGLYSFRNEKRGSWYVQALCSQLGAHGKTKDLVSLLTDVNRIVGQTFRSVNKERPHLHGMVQAPCFTSSLTRRLSFGQRGHPSHLCFPPDGSPKKPRLARNEDDSSCESTKSPEGLAAENNLL